MSPASVAGRRTQRGETAQVTVNQPSVLLCDTCCVLFSVSGILACDTHVAPRCIAEHSRYHSIGTVLANQQLLPSWSAVPMSMTTAAAAFPVFSCANQLCVFALQGSRM